MNIKSSGFSDTLEKCVRACVRVCACPCVRVRACVCAAHRGTKPFITHLHRHVELCFGKFVLLFCCC